MLTVTVRTTLNRARLPARLLEFVTSAMRSCEVSTQPRETLAGQGVRRQRQGRRGPQHRRHDGRVWH